jgi:O-antigen ligase
LKFRLIFVTIFLLLIDKLVFLFLPSFPGGIKHLLLFLFVLYGWYVTGSKLYYHDKNYLILIFFNCLYITILFFTTNVSVVNYFIGFVFTYLFSFIFILSSNTKNSTKNLFNLFKSLIYIFLPLSFITVFASLITGYQINTNYIGVFRELGAFGTILNISSILCLVLFLKTNNRKYIILAGVFSIIIFLTIMKKSILSNCIIWFIYLFSKGSIKQKIFQSLIFVSIFILAIFFMRNQLIENITKNIDYVSDAGDEHVRIAMYNAAFKIASDHFPFGTGTGTFGSLPSLYNGYSKVYYDYNIYLIEPLSPERVLEGEGHDLFDTFWPHIIGELGFLGTILFILLWFYPIFKAVIHYKNTSSKEIKALAFYVISIGVVMFIEGFALYTPEISAFIIFHSCFTGLCFYHFHRSNKLLQNA